jgi:hypothetical protein
MKKRWLLRVGLLAGLALFGFWFVPWLTAPNYQINQKVTDQIQWGMTDKEVEQIIGVPPGTYVHLPFQVAVPHFFEPPEDTIEKNWLGSDGIIQVYFDHRGLVCTKDFIPVRLEEPLVHKIRRWLNLP